MCGSLFHCVKSVQIQSFFWSVFSCFRTEYGDLLPKSPYSVRIQENTDQKKLRIWTLFKQCLPSSYRMSVTYKFSKMSLMPILYPTILKKKYFRGELFSNKDIFQMFCSTCDAHIISAYWSIFFEKFNVKQPIKENIFIKVLLTS